MNLTRLEGRRASSIRDPGQRWPTSSCGLLAQGSDRASLVAKSALRGSQGLSWRVRDTQNPDQQTARSQIPENPSGCPDGRAGGEDVVDQQDIPSSNRASEVTGPKGIGPPTTCGASAMSLRQAPQLSEWDPDRTLEHSGDLLREDQAVVLTANPAP